MACCKSTSSLLSLIPTPLTHTLISCNPIFFHTASLLIYGVLQERIMTIGFGPHSELFGHSVFLVLCNRLLTCAAASAYVILTEPSMKPVAPLTTYAAVSCTNVIATSCQ